MQSDETKHQSSSKEQIEEKLEKARFRYNFLKSEKTFVTLITIGLAIALITIIVQKFVHIPYYIYVILVSSFSIYFLLSLVGTIKNWTGKSEAASILDKKMHFKERLVTGLEYAEQKEKNKLFGMLANDITSKLDNKSIKTTLPHKLPRATKYFVPVSILLLIILLLPHMYPEESEQIVTNIKKSILETPDLINKSMKKFSKSDTTEPKDSEVEKKDKLKQEEKPKEPQNEQEGKKLAETKTEKSEEEQDKKKGQQLQAQATKDKTNSLQDEISKLLSKINSTLDKLENKTKPAEDVKEEKPKLADSGITKGQQKEDEPQQTAKTEKKPLESKEKEPTKTADASESDEKTPEQEQTKDQKRKQKPKIPESKLLQKLAQFLKSQKDMENFPQPSIPIGGMDKDQADSLKDKLDQNKKTESSTSKDSSDSPQQKLPQEELSKGTSKPEKSEPAPSGSSDKNMPETQQQEANAGTGDKGTEYQEDLKSGSDNAPSQIPEGADTPTKGQKGSGSDLKDKLTQADREPGGTASQASPLSATREDMERSQEQQQMKDTPDTKKKDSKSMSDTEQTTKDSQGGQGESQNTGGTEVASGKDKESGTGTEQKGAGEKSGTEQKGAGKESGEEQKVAGKGSGAEQKGAGEKSGTEQKGAGKESGEEQKVAGKESGTEQKDTGEKPGSEQKGTSKEPDEEQKVASKGAGAEQKGAGEKPGSEQKGTGKEPGEEKKVAGKESGAEQKDAGEKSGSEQMGAGKEPGEGQKVASKGAGAEQKGAGEKSGTEQKGTGKEPGEGQKVASKGAGAEQKGAGEKPGSEQKGAGKESGEGQKVAQLDKTAMTKTGGMPQKQTTNNQGMAGGSKSNAQSTADLKDKIMNQMKNLSSQISNLEKEMGLDVGKSMEMENDLKDINELKNTDIDKKEQKGSNKLQEDTSEIVTTAGNKPGEKLYSSEPKEIEIPENSEKFKLQLKGIKDESGTKRETISTGKGKATTKRRLPTVNYDNTVKLSTQQAEDDALRNTSIPLEYEEIIKKIHSEKE